VAGLHAVVEGAGPRIVLVHGFTQTQACWGPLATDLAADHQVCRVDAPGHGGSADVRADLPTGAGLVGDVGGPATYIGYSMGGRLLLHLALARPEVVRGLVLISATAGIDDPEERAARRGADDELAAEVERDGLEAFVDSWLARPMFAGLGPEAQCRTERLGNTAEGLASSLRLAGTGTQVPLWDALGTLEAPVLVVAGELDPRFAALGRRLADAIGAGAELEVVGRAGHTAHLEQPDAVLARLRRWLAAHDL
jgi:2-succinyl-6-hydroxy-2,4-cyclohexadiene-1-carboxylate synthase